MSSYGAALDVRPEGEPQARGSSAAVEAPLFRARPSSIAARFADRLAGWHPLAAGAAALVIGYAALLFVTIAFGALLVEVVLGGWLSRWDNGAIEWLADHRTPLETDWSWVGSHLAETGTVLAVVAVVVLILCLRRRFLATIFFVVAIAVEAATYLATTLVIDRPRPHVVRFENLGSGASFPSGHTAASVVVYVGIAMLVVAYSRNGLARWSAIALAVVAPVAVAVARMYRGMHHPIDVICGALIGVGCLGVGLLVARVIGAVYEHHREGAMS